jgi:DNA-binding protein YbaB
MSNHDNEELLEPDEKVLVKELIRLATKAVSEAVRVAAIKEMFDRGFGLSRAR